MMSLAFPDIYMLMLMDPEQFQLNFMVVQEKEHHLQELILPNTHHKDIKQTLCFITTGV